MLFLACACGTPPANTKRVSIRLEDSSGNTGIGIVEMDIPRKWDTALQWYHESDCSSCDEIKYRFQASSYPVYLENGFFRQEATGDSIDQLTIIHPAAPHPGGKYAQMNIQRLHGNRKDGYRRLDASLPFLWDTIMRIGNTEFSVIAPASDKLNATAIINNVPVQFNFRRVIKRQPAGPEAFLPGAMEILKSVKITPSPLPPRTQD